MNVAVLGASNKEERPSYLAVELLKEKGYNVFPIHPTLDSINDVKVFPSLRALTDSIDTLSVYVSNDISTDLADAILSAKPKRIIFNPGTENADLESKANKAHIDTLNACTLTLLKTDQF